MRPKTIGIVGGAGPMAGLCLLKRIIRISQTEYGCWNDSDFPKMILISFPFSDMLSETLDSVKVKNELRECLNNLRKNGADILSIACNTLHAFIDEDRNDLIHLPNALTQEIQKATSKPMVLCTTTTRRSGIYEKSFPCIYPDCARQSEVEDIIDAILKGCDEASLAKRLSALMSSMYAKSIILGCTELSILAPMLQAKEKSIIDPLDILAQKLIKTSFENFEKVI